MQANSAFHSFALSWVMIVMSEVGDKTFLIAALMAMKHSRTLVFTAAFSSLVVMSVLSAVLGHASSNLISKTYTNICAAGLFFVFGTKMAFDGWKMERGNASVQEEMKEVELEMEESHLSRSDDGSMLEAGIAPRIQRSSAHLQRTTSSPASSEAGDEYEDTWTVTKRTVVDGVHNLASLLFSPAWVQTFGMTFLGEWGDRSQIATIAMAAGQDYGWVTLGTITGHAMCTCVAVIGGRLLASKISVRNITLGGAVAFLTFGCIYLYEAFI